MIANCKLAALIALLSCFAATQQVNAQLQRKGLNGELPQCPPAGYQGFRSIRQAPSNVDMFDSDATLVQTCYDVGGVKAPHDLGDKDAQPIEYPTYQCLGKDNQDLTCQAYAALNAPVPNGQAIWFMISLEKPQQDDGTTRSSLDAIF
ncbi:hypothetical protein CBOM_06616 [Ceraceosorus bombacis]|uniref:Uncharacterized protein n=1 Tax=Ceraceosorus bombacis TaxID=401625 RepID=A0A0P1BJY3_9BASI|nr:hypothetical protein CBOM_06616 [Ceraceosorus bombacis]